MRSAQSGKSARSAQSIKALRTARPIEATRFAQRGEALRSAQPIEATGTAQTIQALRLAQSIEAMRTAPSAAPPSCFYFRMCDRAAEIEKCGKAVCRQCAATNLRGREYPLRKPTRRPLYSSDNEAADSLDMDASASTRRSTSRTSPYSFD
ncbi:MAG: hypothetical protein WBF06_13035 [Candidatus Acidiferrales bacterium]